MKPINLSLAMHKKFKNYTLNIRPRLKNYKLKLKKLKKICKMLRDIFKENFKTRLMI